MSDIILGVGAQIENQAKLIQDSYNLGARMGEAMQRGVSKSQPLGRITGQASEFQKSMDAASARVIAFGSTVGSIRALKDGFDKLVDSTITVEKELKNINLYLGASANSLKSFSNDLFKTAIQTGTSFEDAAKAAQEFSRQGLTMNEVLKRTRDALELARLTGSSMEDAITNLTSIMNSFGKESLNTTMIIDKLIGVGGKFAVSADDIAEALKRVGSSANDAGVHFDDMIALITSAQHITGRSASVIGNSFKTMFARLERPKVLDDLEAIGVEVRNASGSILPLMDILKNLSSRYETLSSSQKSFITEIVGSVFQINTLKAVLNDLGGGFSIVSQAQVAAANSTGLAQKRVEQLNTTISTQLKQSATIWQNTLSNIGNLTLAPQSRGFIKSFQNLGLQTSQLLGGETKGHPINAGAQGALQGAANFLTGPGLQMGAMGLFAILGKLGVFIKDAYKDTLGLDTVEKQRVVNNNAILNILRQNDGALIKQIESGKNLNEVFREILNTISLNEMGLQKQAIYAARLVEMMQKTGNLGVAQNLSNLSNRTSPVAIPNLALGDGISDALQRENKVTGGYGIISQSNLLKTVSNPYGLAAIDSRTQKSADEAISQHMMLGQSLSNIQTTKSSIPNLDTGLGNSDSTFMLQLMIDMLAGTQTIGVGSKMKDKLGKSSFAGAIPFNTIEDTFSPATSKQRSNVSFYEGQLKALEKSKIELEKFGKVIVQVTENGQKVDKVFNNMANFEQEYYNSRKMSTQESLNKTQQEITSQRGASFNQGLKKAWIGNILGGIAAEEVRPYSPNAARGVESFTKDLTIAGQLQMLFPNSKFSKGATYGLMGMGLANAVKEGFSGTANEEAQFGKSQDKFQKMSTSLDALAQSIANLDNYVVDSSVTFDALVRESRKYQDALMQFESSGASQSDINAIRNAPDNKSRIQAIEKLRYTEGQKLDTQAVALSLSQASQTKGGFLGELTGNGLFSYKNEFDKDSSLGMLNNTASQFLGNLSDSNRKRLQNKLSNNGFLSFQDLTTSNKQNNVLLNGISRSGTFNDKNLIRKQISYMLAQSMAENSPEGKDARQRAIEANRIANEPLENANRTLQSYRVILANATQMNVGYGIQGIGAQRELGFSQEAINLARAEAGGKIIGLTSGSKTQASYSAQQEIARTNLQTRQKISQSDINFTQNFAKVFAQGAGQTVEKTLNNVNNPLESDTAVGIGERDQRLIGALNKGLTTTIQNSGGNLFNNDIRNNNFEPFQQSILKNSGLQEGSIDYQSLQNSLKSFSTSPELLTAIKEHTIELVNISREGNQQAQESASKLDVELQAIKIQQNSTFLGGVNSIQKLGSGMGLMGEYRRDLSLSHSSNPIIAAKGSFGLLQWMKENSGMDVSFGKFQNGAYSTTGGSALQNAESELANKFLIGYQAQQSRMLGRLGGGPLSEAMMNNLNSQGTEIGRNALETAIHPEKNLNYNPQEDLSGFENNLKTAMGYLDNAGVSIEDLSKKINDLVKDIATNIGPTSQKQTSANNQVVQKIVNDVMSNYGQKEITTNNLNKSGFTSGLVGGLGKLGEGAAGIIPIVVGQIIANKIGGGLGKAKKRIFKNSYENSRTRPSQVEGFSGEPTTSGIILDTKQSLRRHQPISERIGVGNQEYNPIQMGIPSFEAGSFSVPINISSAQKQRQFESAQKQIEERQLRVRNQAEIIAASKEKEWDTYEASRQGESYNLKGRTTIENNMYLRERDAFHAENIARLKGLKPVERPYLEKVRIAKIKAAKLAQSTGGQLASLGLGTVIGGSVNESLGGNGLAGMIGGGFIDYSLMNPMKFQSLKGLGTAGIGAVGGIAAAGMFGWNFGQHLNDTHIGINERRAAFSNSQRNDLLDNSSYLKEQQRISGSISNVKYQESMLWKNTHLSNTQKYEDFKSMEAAIKNLTSQMEKVTNEGKQYYDQHPEQTVNGNGGAGEIGPLDVNINFNINGEPNEQVAPAVEAIYQQLSQIQKRLNISQPPPVVSS